MTGAVSSVTNGRADQPRWRVSCDSIVVLPERSKNGTTLFAKNSDRPTSESQPLVQVSAAEHGRGQSVRCQYVEIEQVEHTWAFVGSRPAWLWGCEHGINEHDVVIGNHTIYTKDQVPSSGLLGMDLVRLGLERGRDAESATRVICDLIERHGQGGSGYANSDWPYNNSFLVADPKSAFRIEAVGRHWAQQRIRGAASASNHTVIGEDWDELSAGCEAYAVSQGWWEPSDRRFDFAAAYRDTTVVPTSVSSGRYRTTCERLALSGDGLDTRAATRLMRDHYELGEVHESRFEFGDERYFSVCMHAGELGVTAASMIVELGLGPRVVWVALCNPCIGPYFPVFPRGRLPRPLVTGDAQPPGNTEESAWWKMKSLLTKVETSDPRFANEVRALWADYERDLFVRTKELVAGARNDDAFSSAATEFMSYVWSEISTRVDSLV